MTLVIDETQQPRGANSDGIIRVSATGGWGNYSYQWTGDNGYSSDREDPTDLPGGFYTLLVTDENGCETSLTVNLPAIGIAIQVDITENSDCQPICDGLIEVVSVEGGTGPYTYQWSTGNTGSVLNQICEGDYEVTVVSSDGIRQVFSYSVGIIPMLEAEVNTDELFAEVIPSGGTAPYSYQWTTPDADTTQSVRPAQGGEVFVKITDANGCAIDELVNIPGQENPNAGFCDDVRDIITPNDDGNNDEFVLSCTDNVQVFLQVFNRWGQLVFEDADYKNNWAGQSKNGDVLPEGGYFYIIEYVDPRSEELVQDKGHLTILK